MIKAATILAISFVLPVTVSAQESRVETQAGRCSAVYFVLTAVTEGNPQLGTYFTQMTMAYGEQYARERKRRTGATVTNGDFMARRENVLKELAKTYPQSPRPVEEEALFCLSWTDSVRRANAGEDFSKAWPEGINPRMREAFSEIVTYSFKSWTESGALTPADVRKQIEQNLARPKN